MSLALTRTQNFRDNANLAEYEIRPSLYGAIAMFLAQTRDAGSFVTPSLKEKAWNSIGTTLQIPVIEHQDVTIGNQRTLTIADTVNNSRMIDVSFSTLTFDITQTPAEFHNNEIKLQEDFDAKFRLRLYALMKTLDEMALSNLATNKTHVIGDPLLYNFTENAISAGFYQQDSLLGDLFSMMESNDFQNPYMDVVGSTGISALYRHLKQYGEGNITNKKNELEDKRLFISNNIMANDSAQLAENYARGYAVNRNSLGMLFRAEREGLTQTVTPDGHRWEQTTLPGLEIPCIVYSYQGVANKSTLGGAATSDMDRVVTHYYQYAIDVAMLNTYISNPTTRPTPIIAFDIKREANAAYGSPVAIVADKSATTTASDGAGA